MAEGKDIEGINKNGPEAGTAKAFEFHFFPLCDECPQKTSLTNTLIMSVLLFSKICRFFAYMTV